MSSQVFCASDYIPFPAVTIGPPDSGKWSAIVEALNQVDKNDSIFDTIKLIEEDFKLFSKPFNDYYATQWTMLVNGAVPRSGSVTYSRLDHNLHYENKFTKLM